MRKNLASGAGAHVLLDHFSQLERKASAFAEQNTHASASISSSSSHPQWTGTVSKQGSINSDETTPLLPTKKQS